MIDWIKRCSLTDSIKLPHTNQHCIIVITDRDGKSLVPLNAIYETTINNNAQFVLIDDGIGEIIKPDRVLAYFTYEYKHLTETL